MMDLSCGENVRPKENFIALPSRQKPQTHQIYGALRHQLQQEMAGHKHNPTKNKPMFALEQRMIEMLALRFGQLTTMNGTRTGNLLGEGGDC